MLHQYLQQYYLLQNSNLQETPKYENNKNNEPSADPQQDLSNPGKQQIHNDLHKWKKNATRKKNATIIALPTKHKLVAKPSKVQYY